MAVGMWGRGGLHFFYAVPKSPASSQVLDFPSCEVPATGHLSFTDLDQAWHSPAHMHPAGPVGAGAPACFSDGGTPGAWAPGRVAAHLACSLSPKRDAHLGKDLFLSLSSRVPNTCPFLLVGQPGPVPLTRWEHLSVSADGADRQVQTSEGLGV